MTEEREILQRCQANKFGGGISNGSHRLQTIIFTLADDGSFHFNSLMPIEERRILFYSRKYFFLLLVSYDGKMYLVFQFKHSNYDLGHGDGVLNLVLTAARMVECHNFSL